MSKPVICIGAALVDELFHAMDYIIPATTSPANITKTAGGVARNIAHQIALLDVPVQLISVFGNDSDGDWLKSVSRSAGVQLDAAITIEGQSGKYTGILNVDGSLFAAFITNPVHHYITPAHLQHHEDLLKTASFLLADANINIETIEWLLQFSKSTGIPFIIEPVSVPPAAKLSTINLEGLYMITPNEDELPVLCHEPSASTRSQIEILLSNGIQKIWLHNGAHGSRIVSKDKTATLHAAFVDVVDCTGAGDGSLSGYLLGKHLGKNDDECLRIAHTLSAEILQVNGAIATHLTQEKLLELVPKYFGE